MKIGIICPSDSELNPFLKHIECCTVSEKSMLKIYEGRIGSADIAALYSGVCRTNAAVAAQILIESYSVDTIIVAGVAGGIDSKIKLFDTVVATETAYHDVSGEILTEFHPWMESAWFESDKKLVLCAKKALSDNRRVFYGRIVTGESFIEDDGREEIIRNFSPLAVDMESAAVAHVCYVNSVPFIAVRSVTDTAEHGGHDNFEMNCERASSIAKDITLRIIAEIS